MDTLWHIPVVSAAFVVGDSVVVTGITVVTTGAVETGVKVVATETGVVLMADFVVVSDSVVTAAVVVAAGGSEVVNIKDNQGDKAPLLLDIIHFTIPIELHEAYPFQIYPKAKMGTLSMSCLADGGTDLKIARKIEKNKQERCVIYLSI